MKNCYVVIICVIGLLLSGCNSRVELQEAAASTASDKLELSKQTEGASDHSESIKEVTSPEEAESEVGKDEKDSSSTLTLETEKKRSFRNVDWGMSQQEVREAEGAILLFEDEKELVYQDKINGLLTKLTYKFNPDGLLISSRYSFDMKSNGHILTMTYLN
ncbi:hypothetical protein [Paenibacillus sp. FSL K6-1230]|uniref:hypothetical protein n=1 Tax=Paenibacillus sp. FSL K6-1230 TaxID=2921603 RepID=UPI0030F69EC8